MVCVNSALANQQQRPNKRKHDGGVKPINKKLRSEPATVVSGPTQDLCSCCDQVNHEDFSLQSLDEELSLPQAQRKLILACELGKWEEVAYLLEDPTVSTFSLAAPYALSTLCSDASPSLVLLFFRQVD